MPARIARLISVIEQLPVGVVVADAGSGAVTLVNQRAREILDHPIEPHDRPADFFEAYSFHANGRPYEHDRHPFTRALRHGEVVAGEELHYVTGAGARVILSVTAAPLRDGASRIVETLLIFTNVTERRRLETDLAQSRRLEGLGRLADDVVHDFNNLLTAITGYAELLQLKTPELQHTDGILHCASRASGLTRQLIAFARPRPLPLDRIDADQVIQRIAPMLARILKVEIRFDSRVGVDGTTLRIDAGQLERIVADLVANAAVTAPGGTVIVETGAVDLHESPAGSRLRARAYVTIAVSDTGSGRNGDARARRFEPIFTGTDLEPGHGLGLATSHGIVERLGGEITVHGEPGQGATFTVYLPVGPADPPWPSGDVAIAPASGGSEAILLVEDDADVRAVTAEMLRAAGYTVVACGSDDGDALTTAFETTARIRLLMTDVILAHGSGAALAASMQQVRPDVKILFVSSDTGAVAARAARLMRTGDAFLSKPFTNDTLRRAVRGVLDADATGRAGLKQEL